MKHSPSYSEQDELNLKVLIALVRGVQSVRRQEMQTVREGKLTLAQFGVLEYLYHRGDARIKDIMERMLSTGGNMTVVIENLEKEGFISRYSDPHDKRARLISLTHRGEALMEDLFPRHVQNISGIFSILQEEEKKQLILFMKKLTGKAQE
jgi:DNA-binding MarR family transcriptional regulator